MVIVIARCRQRRFTALPEAAKLRVDEEVQTDPAFPSALLAYHYRTGRHL